jgi:hypothetical protein
MHNTCPKGSIEKRQKAKHEGPQAGHVGMLTFPQRSADIPQCLEAGKAVLRTIFPQENASGIAKELL